MTLRALQPEALSDLDATIARAEHVVEPALLAGVRQRIAHTVAEGPTPHAPRDQREADTFAVVDQMLIDVAGLDDSTVQRAAAHFPDGQFADLVMASYAIEARTRLEVAADRLLGGFA
jgi:hypothetical protein